MKKQLKNRKFTLLELLVTVSILVAVSAVATVTFNDVIVDSDEAVLHIEMQQIALAIRRFKADTGYYPKTGPFDIATTDGVTADDLPVDSDQTRWFYSPANFYQLLQNPLEDTNHPLKDWVPETGRGWNGPYLTGFDLVRVNIGDEINKGLTGDPAGSPDPVFSSDLILGVYGIGDPHDAEPVLAFAEGNPQPFEWSYKTRDRDGDLVDQSYQRYGRPYLVFDWDSQPYIVSFGEDGVYGNQDDIRLGIEGMPNENKGN